MLGNFQLIADTPGLHIEKTRVRCKRLLRNIYFALFVIMADLSINYVSGLGCTWLDLLSSRDHSTWQCYHLCLFTCSSLEYLVFQCWESLESRSGDTCLNIKSTSERLQNWYPSQRNSGNHVLKETKKTIGAEPEYIHWKPKDNSAGDKKRPPKVRHSNHKHRRGKPEWRHNRRDPWKCAI